MGREGKLKLIFFFFFYIKSCKTNYWGWEGKKIVFPFRDLLDLKRKKYAFKPFIDLNLQV